MVKKDQRKPHSIVKYKNNNYMRAIRSGRTHCAIICASGDVEKNAGTRAMVCTSVAISLPKNAGTSGCLSRRFIKRMKIAAYNIDSISQMGKTFILIVFVALCNAMILYTTE